MEAKSGVHVPGENWLVHNSEPGRFAFDSTYTSDECLRLGMRLVMDPIKVILNNHLVLASLHTSFV